MKKWQINGLNILTIISITVLTSLVTLITSNKIAILSIALSSIIATVLIYHYKFVIKILKLKPCLNIKVEYLGCLILTFFSGRYIIRYLSYNEAFIKRAINKMAELLGFDYTTILKPTYFLLMLIASVSIFLIYIYIIRKLLPIIIDFAKKMSKIEKLFLLFSTLIMVVFMGVCYYKTNVFYAPVVEGTNYIQLYDVVYITDTGVQINSDSFKNFIAPENDFRQPLFALFSFPFGLISGIVADVFKFIPYFLCYSFMIGFFQIVLLNMIAIFLSRMVTKNGSIFMMILYSCTFPYILFALNIEQYVIGLFWLILFIYSFIESKRSSAILFLSATGSLVTNGILLLFAKGKDNFKKYLLKSIEYCFYFISLIIIFGQLNNFLSGIFHFSKYRGSMGFAATFTDKLLQFLSFISSCFIAPSSMVNTTTYEHVSYQLAPVTSVSLVGLLLLVICVVSFILNRKETIVKVAFGWILYSFLILCIIGWGTAENGLILYTIYFSWAYIILIYKFIEKLCIHCQTLKKFIFITLFVAMLTLNISGIMQIVKFGLEYYPYH